MFGVTGNDIAEILSVLERVGLEGILVGVTDYAVYVLHVAKSDLWQWRRTAKQPENIMERRIS